MCVRSPYIFRCQRLRSPSRHLWRVVVERLVGPDFFIFRSERKGEGGKWAKNAQNRPVRAVRGHFGPIFHHFSVLEPSQGHFCITFLLNWVPRSFPRRCVIPRAEFSFLRSNVSVQVRRSLVRRNLQRLVGSHFHRLFLASHSQIVPARSWSFFLSGEGPLCAQLPI